MGDIKINCELVVSDRSFTNSETGEVINYKAVVAVIDGINVNLSVKTDCKKLFDYVLSRYTPKKQA